MVNYPPANIGDIRGDPGLGRSPGGGNGNPLQYSCLDNPMVRGAWWATAHEVAKSQARLKRQHIVFINDLVRIQSHHFMANRWGNSGNSGSL